MTKKDRSSSDQDKKRRKGLTVRTASGTRQRFLRGMVTHDLVQRGLAFDDAYAVAQAVRDRLTDHHEVTTTEIRELVRAELEERLGPDVPVHLLTSATTVPDLTVLYNGRPLPFSRGLLARSIHAAGVGFDRAYDLVAELEKEMRHEETMSVSSTDVARRVGDLLERSESPEAAQRYRLVRRIQRLPRPLVMYIGGASGTGKSTLSLGLAPLLRIYRINATDTIRQVMRMVFSPNVLPVLHTSSFELAGDYQGVGQTGDDDSRDFDDRLIANFEEQATRVSVGVRAVVERAIAENMSILVEGVHLYPPLVPFPDLEGAAYQVPMVLASLDPEAHRSRFLARARFGGRRAERYLEKFGAIRTIHDFILQQAETHDVPLLDTPEGDTSVTPALRLITSFLERRLPDLAQPEAKPRRRIPTLLVIIDGLPDQPVRALGGRTPLQAAATPTLDRLAREGRSGLADPVAPGVVADTAAGSLALFGQSPLAMKRGPVEALGTDLELNAGDIALRANLATLDDQGQVIDRRAGRIRHEAPELAKAIDRLPLPGSLSDEVEVRVAAATEHRLAVVLKGDGLSSQITGSDPGDGAVPGPAITPHPLDPHNEAAVATARILALFEEKARRALSKHSLNRKRIEAGLAPANAILTRGAGRIHRLLSLEEAGTPLRLACVAGDRTILGLAAWLGAETIAEEGMTANLDTDLEAKLDAVESALEHNELVTLHLKGADIAAHDRRPDLKVDFLERLDTVLGDFLERREKPLRIAVASDHATLSESGQHAADPLPVLIWGEGVEADGVERFDENAAGAGDLQRFPLQMLLSRLFDLA